MLEDSAEAGTTVRNMYGNAYRRYPRCSTWEPAAVKPPASLAPLPERTIATEADARNLPGGTSTSAGARR